LNEKLAGSMPGAVRVVKSQRGNECQKARICCAEATMRGACCFEREALPHVQDAWIDGEKTQIGYEISLVRYFCQPAPLRSQAEADILALAQESESLLERIVGEASCP
jgi:hypothetical protein